jgi:hypothetical protein
VTTLIAKYLINQYYGVGPHHSYWVGCSNGGLHGMVMSQNFPSFFDGIIAGDSSYDLEAVALSDLYGLEQILNVYNANPSLPPLSDLPQPAPQPPAPILYPAFPVADQALLETALLQACDALDGVPDGVIDNLPACKAKFDPATATYTSGGANALAAEFGYAFLSPQQPNFYARGFNFDTDLEKLNRNTPLVTYSTSVNIRRFVDYGHKIIWFHGLSDPGVPVLGTIKYYEEMAQQFGGLDQAQQFSRLYPVPNMGHCSRGPATDRFDLLTPLADWVENGTPPGPINATGVNFTPATYQVSFVQGPATRTRPLCPYPQQARFTGSVSVIGGVPVATNQADLADPTKYQCISAQPWELE